MGLLAKFVGASIVASFGGVCYVLKNPDKTRPTFDATLIPPLVHQEQPTRTRCMQWLRSASSPADALDILVVGGGATGTGVALDGATRGLRVGLVEANDYASGTSSRSTKLIHGGVRYLEKAVLHLDRQQYNLVAEALRERAILIHQAPHLCRPLPTVVPCFDPFDVMKYFVAMKLYDAIAAVNSGSLLNSYFKIPVQCLTDYRKMTYENKDRQTLLGGVVYYDGQMDDARLCLSTALTAASYGAAVTNYTELRSATVVHEGGQELVKAELFDKIKKQSFTVYTRCVVNAGGPFSDQVRRLSGDARLDSLVPSSGTHITLPAAYCPKDSAMLVPSADGRVTFAVPWLGSCIVGTTDTPTTTSWTPRGSKEDVSFLLSSLSRYVGKVDPKDVQSVWCGIRPLSMSLPPAGQDSSKQAATSSSRPVTSTQEVVREHLVDVNTIQRVVSITGGKWTTYRKMSEDVVNAVLSSALLSHSASRATPCVTEHVRMVGATTFTDGAAPAVTYPQTFPAEVQKRWESAFGDRAVLVAAEAAALANKKSSWGKVDPVAFGTAHPSATAQAITDAEIRYCTLNEHCQTVSDYLERRSRLAFLNVREALEEVPKVAEVMGETLGWSKSERRSQEDAARKSLEQFTPL